MHVILFEILIAVLFSMDLISSDSCTTSWSWSKAGHVWGTSTTNDLKSRGPVRNFSWEDRRVLRFRYSSRVQRSCHAAIKASYVGSWCQWWVDTRGRLVSIWWFTELFVLLCEILFIASKLGPATWYLELYLLSIQWTYYILFAMWFWDAELPEVGPLKPEDVELALRNTRPSAHLQAHRYDKFNQDYGSQLLV